MNKLIKLSQIWDIMQRKDAKGRNIPFQIKFVKKNGEVREYNECTLTSFHSLGSTINVLPKGETFPRSIRRISIVEFNKHKTYL